MTGLRTATARDLPAITALQRAYDTGWFGEPENDEGEVREWFDLADSACVVEADGRVVGAGRIHRTGSDVLADPGGDPAAAYRLLVAWLRDGGAAETEALDRDDPLCRLLTGAGWRHVRSSFDLVRPVSAEWRRPAAQWPPGVDVRPYVPADAAAVHHLVYVDAGWAGVAGHHARGFDEWRQIFLPTPAAGPAPLLARRGDRLVGAALLRIFSDGTGWIGQLAVAADERRRGLGRALLLAGLDRLVEAGASKLGLSVIATNRAALRLYLDVGLTVDREWQTFARPGG